MGVLLLRDRDDNPRAPAGAPTAAPTSTEPPAATTSTTSAGATAPSMTTSTTRPGGGAATATTSTTTSAVTTTTAGSAGTTVRHGTWGGSGIRMTVTASGASVAYDCATGTIEAPLAVGPGGGFAVAGTHTRLRPGPPDPASPLRPETARYAGTTDGTGMRLTVTLSESGATLGPFVLTFGDQGLLNRCG